MSEALTHCRACGDALTLGGERRLGVCTTCVGRSSQPAARLPRPGYAPPAREPE